MSGVLYIVGTPIGNLSDLTPRAAEAFEKADFIAAEDTRVTVKLLNHLGLKKPMVSYYEHNLQQRGDEILNRVENGETCAMCSDAGMPAISDPGEILVRDAHLRGIKVVPVPAASAAITALCVSGLITSRFVFEGFLPTNKRQKKDRLQEISKCEMTMILYEAPHKLVDTLAGLQEAVGVNRKLTICRELTKMHEEILPITVGEAVLKYNEDKPRGEFVLVLEGAEKEEQVQLTLEDAAQIALDLVEKGERLADAAKIAATQTSFSKSDIYRYCQSAPKE